MALRRHAFVLCLLAATLVSCLSLAHWGLPDGATVETTSPWAVDAIAPLGPLREANARFARIESEPVLYPLFHYMVLCAAYAPYVLYAMLTGAFESPRAVFPYGAADPEGFFAALSVIASAVSALMAAGIVLWIYLLGRDLFGQRAGTWAALFAALLPPLAYYGTTSNLDVPYLFWTLAATWLLVRAALGGSARTFLLCGVCAGLAFATKDQAAGFFVSWPVVVLAIVVRDRRRAGLPALGGAFADRRVLAAAVGAVAAFVLGNNLLFGGWHGFVRHLAFMDTFYEANVATQERSVLVQQPAALVESTLLVLQMMGAATALLAVAGLVLAWRRKNYPAALLPLSALTCYVAVVAPTAPLSRYLLGMVLLALPFAGFAVAAGLESASRATRRAALGIALLAAIWQGALVLHLHATLHHDSRYAMAAWVRAHVPAGSTIESSTQARYLPRLADHYRYQIVGNRFDAVNYGLEAADLSAGQLARRRPPYVMVLADVGLSGDPARVDEPALRDYYGALLAGRAGYVEVARFETPSWLPYRQLTAGTQPTTILLRRRDLVAGSP